MNIPDHPGIHFEEQTITYGMMNRRAESLARGHSSRAAFGCHSGPKVRPAGEDRQDNCRKIPIYETCTPIFRGFSSLALGIIISKIPSL
jgi:hypothetical protein